MPDDHSHGDRPAALGERRERPTQRREELPVGRRSQRRNVDAMLGARDQVLDLQHQRVGVTGKDIARAAPPEVGGLHEPAWRQAIAAREIVGDAGKGAIDVALRQLGLQLLEQRHIGLFVGHANTAVVDDLGDRRGAVHRAFEAVR